MEHQKVKQMPLKFQPGEQWDYLDANYMVLGYIVEKVSGISLHDFIQTNIFDKAGMKETGFITHDHPVPYSSVSYIELIVTDLYKIVKNTMGPIQTASKKI
ncbi:serine hydrolase domain-containing protein [Bacillota bacterium Lsc_1132]